MYGCCWLPLVYGSLFSLPISFLFTSNPNMDSPPECPATPKRRHVARFPNFGHVTPKSAHSHRRKRSIDVFSDVPSTPARSPFFSPKSARKGKQNSGNSLKTFNDAFVPYLSTPYTGSSRKVKNFTEQVKPSLKSKCLTETLHAASRESEESIKTVFLPEISLSGSLLRTPSPRVCSTFESKNAETVTSDSEDEVQVVSMESLKDIPRFHMDSPFLEPLLPRKPKRESAGVDLSKNLELVNHRTGERIVRPLTEEEMRFRPRRLEFTPAVAPGAVNYHIANKFVGNNIGNKFTMDAGEPALGFSIFSDEDH